MQGLTIWQINGKNVERFLQGQLSVNVASGTRFFCYCNAKGRICTIGWVLKTNNVWHLAIPETNADAMFLAWKPYATLSQIVHEQTYSIGWDILSEPTENSWQKSDQWLCFGKNLFATQNWQTWALNNGIPIITENTRWNYTPHMLDLHLLGAIDFDKGCFLGQEIIARTQHLGKQKRKLITFKNPESKLAINQVITDENGQDAGQVLFVGTEKSQAVVNLGSDYYIQEKLALC